MRREGIPADDGMKAHGIMFHHFHDGYNKHIRCQGSLSKDDLNKLIDFYGKKYHIISAEEFLWKSNNKVLASDDVCLAFDDGLLCQYDIAYPVLKQKGIGAFWFIYTSPQEGIKEKLEIYHHFRFSKFKDIDEFYMYFFEVGGRYEGFYNALKSDEAYNYKIEEPYYTENDRRFRYVRDCYLDIKEYDNIINNMMVKCNYDVEKYVELLWMKKQHIRELSDEGHIIGLHSHTHPTVMASLHFDEQKKEYVTNKSILEKITGKKIVTVAYPCNSYNYDTVDIMHELEIDIGFRANMADGYKVDPNLEIPREDHSNIMKEVQSL